MTMFPGPPMLLELARVTEDINPTAVPEGSTPVPLSEIVGWEV
jgi:hypothetical protein